MQLFTSLHIHQPPLQIFELDIIEGRSDASTPDVLGHVLEKIMSLVKEIKVNPARQQAAEAASTNGMIG